MTTTPSKAKPYTRQTFIDLFNSIAHHKHRYEVFKDFIFLSAIELHNSIFTKENKDQALEQEYIAIVGKYSRAEFDKFCQLFCNLIDLLQVEPTDVIGGLYMELNLTNEKTGQFFSPPEISTFMAKILAGDALKNMQECHKPFITLSEPACGAGGMVLAFASEMMNQGVNPAYKLFVQCVDIDRLAAFMCFIQLSLWGIPAQIIVGDTLTMEYRESYYTTMFYLQRWETRLQYRQLMSLLDVATEATPEATEPSHGDGQGETIKPKIPIHTETKNHANTHSKTKPTLAINGLHQVDLFDFTIDHPNDEATGQQ
jgi:hypothetical protein